MYPRNASLPPRIAVGAVVQISDGSVQLAGCNIVVRPDGGSETTGGGTVEYGSSSGIVYYTPTQAETNYVAFVVAAYKTGCVPVAQTIITSASNVSGTVSVSGTVDVGKINGNANSATALSATTAAIGRGQCASGGTTTSIPTSAFSPAGAAIDQFKGRVITFDAGTATSQLRGQATLITGSTAVSTPTFTVVALSNAPASGDTFSVT